MGLCCSSNCSSSTSDKCNSPCSPVSLTPIPITKVEKAPCVLTVRDGGKRSALAEVSLVGNLVTSEASDNHVMSKLSTIVKGKVSKNRIRFRQDGYDLDLTYICSNIIAMGYPASKIEAVYRNNIEDVARFLDGAHMDHYKIYNLCSERSYDTSKFHNRVEVFPFNDHNPPNLELINPFCNSVDEWLKEDSRNVAVVHCKAGKGRTGTMICCYLLHSGKFLNSEDALNHYGSKRTQDMKGVTIPSQLRYVNYYARLVKDSMIYRPVQVYIKEVILEPSPCFSGGNMGTLSFSISQPITAEGQNGQPHQKLKKVLKSEEHDVKKSVPKFSVQLDSCSPLVGDIKVEFCYKMLRKETLFQFWFNTFFVCEKIHVYDSNGCINKNGSSTTNADDLLQQQTFKFTLSKKELDVVNKKDKQNKMFSSDFHVTLLLSRVPTRVYPHVPPPPPTNHLSNTTTTTTSPPSLPNHHHHHHHNKTFPSQLHISAPLHGNGAAIQPQQQQQFLIMKQQQQHVMSNNNVRDQQQHRGVFGGMRSGVGVMTPLSTSQGMIIAGQGQGLGHGPNTTAPSTYNHPATNKLPPHQQQQQPHTSTGALQSSTSSTAVIIQQQQHPTSTCTSDSSTTTTSDDDDDSSSQDGDKNCDDEDDDYNWDSGESTYL